MWADVRDFTERASLAQSVAELNFAFGQIIETWGFNHYKAIQLSSRQQDLRSNADRTRQGVNFAWLHHYREVGHVRWDADIARIMSSTEPFWCTPVQGEVPLSNVMPVLGEGAECQYSYSLVIPVRPQNGSVWGCTLSTAQLDACAELTLAAVAAANSYVVRSIWLQETSEQKSPPAFALTPRQREVVTWLARGLTTHEIGGFLGTSARTVAHQLNEAKRRLKARTLSSLVAEAMTLGEITA